MCRNSTAKYTPWYKPEFPGLVHRARLTPNRHFDLESFPLTGKVREPRERNPTAPGAAQKILDFDLSKFVGKGGYVEIGALEIGSTLREASNHYISLHSHFNHGSVVMPSIPLDEHPLLCDTDDARRAVRHETRPALNRRIQADLDKREALKLDKSAIANRKKWGDKMSRIWRGESSHSKDEVDLSVAAEVHIDNDAQAPIAKRKRRVAHYSEDDEWEKPPTKRRQRGVPDLLRRFGEL
jgi:hypothetical protein